MNTVLKGFEEAFREMISERITKRMKEDADKCLTTESRENLKLYARREKLEVLVISGDTSAFDVFFDRLNSLADGKGNTISNAIYLNGTKGGVDVWAIYLSGLKGSFRLHTLIMLDENGTGGKFEDSFILNRMEENYKQRSDMLKGKERCQPCLQD